MSKHRSSVHHLPSRLAGRLALSALAVVLGLLATQPARAQDAYAADMKAGRTAYKSSDMAVAQTHFAAALAKAENDRQKSAAHYALGVVAQKQSKLPDAKKHAEQALALNPQDAQAKGLLDEVTAAPAPAPAKGAKKAVAKTALNKPLPPATKKAAAATPAIAPAVGTAAPASDAPKPEDTPPAAKPKAPPKPKAAAKTPADPGAAAKTEAGKTEGGKAEPAKPAAAKTGAAKSAKTGASKAAPAKPAETAPAAAPADAQPPAAPAAPGKSGALPGDGPAVASLAAPPPMAAATPPDPDTPPDKPKAAASAPPPPRPPGETAAVQPAPPVTTSRATGSVISEAAAATLPVQPTPIRKQLEKARYIEMTCGPDYRGADLLAARAIEVVPAGDQGEIVTFDIVCQKDAAGSAVPRTLLRSDEAEVVRAPLRRGPDGTWAYVHQSGQRQVRIRLDAETLTIVPSAVEVAVLRRKLAENPAQMETMGARERRNLELAVSGEGYPEFRRVTKADGLDEVFARALPAAKPRP